MTFVLLAKTPLGFRPKFSDDGGVEVALNMTSGLFVTNLLLLVWDAGL